MAFGRAARLEYPNGVQKRRLASLPGAMLCNDDTDRVTLFAKAAAELLDRGQSAEAVNRQLQELWDLLEALL